MNARALKAIAVTIFLLLPYRSAAAGEENVIAGVVRDVDTGKPVWGALVTLKTTKKTAVTDKQGRFSISGVLRGSYRMSVSLSGYETLDQEVRCPDADVEVWLLASEETVDREEIIITSKREKRQASGRAEVSVHLVPHEVIIDSAGAMEDPVRVVGSLPGVVPASEITPLFFVRGGAAHESFFYLDDAMIYNPFQLGGGATIFNPSLIEDMKFFAGGHGVEYPGSLSGVLDIRYRDPKDDAYYANAELSLISTNLDVEGPTFSGGPAFLVSFRRSNFEIPLWIAQGLELVSDRFAAPAFMDVFVRLNQRIARGHSLTFSGFITDDGVDLIEFEPEDVEGFGSGTFFYKNRTYVGILRYRGQHSDDLVHTAMFSSVSNTIDAEATGDNPVAVDSRVHSFTLRSDWLARFGGENNLMWGFFLNRTQVDILANSPDIRRFVMGLRIGGDLNVENIDYELTFPFLLYGAYLKQSWSFLSDCIVVEPGIRLSYEQPAHQMLIEPRAAVRVKILKSLEARLASGLYTQPVLNPIAVDSNLGSPQLSAERAVHLIGGLEWTPHKEWRVRVEGFVKFYDHLTTNTDDVEGYLSGRVESFTAEGTGGAYGGDIFIEKRGRTWAGWLSYGYLSAWRKNPRLEREYADAANLNPGQDVPHTLALVLFYKPTKNWKFSLRMLAHSGNRYTPLDRDDPFRVELDANDGRPIWRINPDYERLNENRAPFYFKTDIRGSYSWFFKTWHLQIFVELMNAQYRMNTLLFASNRGRVPEQEPRYGPVFELPIIPFFGVKGGF